MVIMLQQQPPIDRNQGFGEVPPGYTSTVINPLGVSMTKTSSSPSRLVQYIVEMLMRLDLSVKKT